MPIPHVESSESSASSRTGPPYFLVSRTSFVSRNRGPGVVPFPETVLSFPETVVPVPETVLPFPETVWLVPETVLSFPETVWLVPETVWLVPETVFISIRAHRAQLREGGFEIGHRSRLGTQPLARRAGGKPPQVTSRIRALLRMGSAPRELINPNHGRHQSRLQAPKAATEPATHVGSRAPRREVVGHSGACSFEPGSAPPAGAASSAALRHMAPGCAGAFLWCSSARCWGTWICSSGFFGDPRCVLRFRRVFLSCSVGSPE